MQPFDPKKLAQGSSILQKLFENGDSPLSQQFLRWKLWMKWAEYVGPTIGKICEPVGYRRGTLYVWVTNASWMQQLVFGLEPMKNKINAQLGFNYIKAIYLTLDRRSVPSDPQDAQQLKDSIHGLMDQGDDSSF